MSKVGIRKINMKYQPVGQSCNPYVFPHAKIDKKMNFLKFYNKLKLFYVKLF
jgi:hypothetical protein